MKKKTAAIIIAALVITLGGTTAFAFGTQQFLRYQKSENRIRGIFRYPVQPKQRMFLL